jgi:histone-lysine N-methyltransferase SETMAR
MLCIWWDMEGVIHYELRERNLTVAAERYCQQLRHLEKAIQQKRPGRRHGVILQHDNARPHTANMTKSAIQELVFHIHPTLRTLPHRITTSSALSPTICAARSFLQQRR